MDDAHSVKIVDSIQDLADESAGIFLCVKSFFHYPIKQLSTGYTVEKKKRNKLDVWEDLLNRSEKNINKSFQGDKRHDFYLKNESTTRVKFCPIYSPEGDTREVLLGHSGTNFQDEIKENKPGPRGWPGLTSLSWLMYASMLR